MSKYRIRKLKFNNSDDFNLYLELKSFFMTEIMENNPSFVGIVNNMQVNSNNQALKAKIYAYLPFLKNTLDVYVLEELVNTSDSKQTYQAIAYTSINKNAYIDGELDIDRKNTISIENLFVNPTHRLSSETLELLKYAIRSSTEGKNKNVTFNVLSTNPNKYFHFALADCVLMEQIFINNIDMSKISMYYLYCEDSNKILNTTIKELFEKAVNLQREPTYKNTNIPLSLCEDLDLDPTL